jgi:hypothetical protein
VSEVTVRKPTDWIAAGGNMNSRPLGFEDIQDRLLKLEKENRRFKQLGAVVLAIATAIVAMGQGQAKKTVEANEFLLKDADGKLRVRIGMGLDFQHKDGPAIVLFDAENFPRISISTSEDQAKIEVNSPQLSASSAMWAGSPGKSGSGLGINGPAGVFRVNLDGPAIDGPQVSIEDKEGYSTEIGRSDLVTKTGRQEKTPAASLILFNKDKKIMWSAP